MAGPVESVDRGKDVLARRIRVNLPAEAIFARLDNPHRHHEIDGSGTVQAKVEGPTTLTKGARFTVAMKMFGLPYRITSTVVDHEPNRVIEWKHPAGHTWRWELEPQPDGTTVVTESWDTRQSKGRPFYKLVGLPGRNAKGIESTLRHLEQNITP